MPHYDMIHRVASVHASGIPWATIFSSLGGLATAGALLVSLVILWQQMRTQRQADQDRRRDHASHISFWFTLDAIFPEPGAYELRGGQGWGGWNRREPGIDIKLHIFNTSERPAKSVRAQLGLRGDVWRNAGAADHAPIGERTTEWTAVAIKPGARLKVDCSLDLPESAAAIIEHYGEEAIIGELLFTDAAGVDWVETHDGRLIERRSAAWTKNMNLSLAQRDEQRQNRAYKDWPRRTGVARDKVAERHQAARDVPEHGASRQPEQTGRDAEADAEPEAGK
jgi:hypothetical protein